MLPQAEREIPIVVRDTGNRERTLHVVPDARTEFAMGDLGVGPEMRAQIISVTPGDPAERAGIAAGDVILEIDGEPVAGGDLVERISGSPGTPLSMTLRRGEDLEQVTVTPVMRDDRAVIGVGFSEFEFRVVEPGLIEAFGMSLERNYEWSGLIFRTLWGLLTAETSPRQLVGPVGIAQLSGGGGAGGVGRPVQPHGDDLPQPRHPQPAADPGPRRRAHLHHGDGRELPAATSACAPRSGC